MWDLNVDDRGNLGLSLIACDASATEPASADAADTQFPHRLPELDPSISAEPRRRRSWHHAINHQVVDHHAIDHQAIDDQSVPQEG